MANYPVSLPSFDQQENGIDVVDAADVNTAYDEITAIATELGTGAKGSAASVSARIAAVESGVTSITGSAVTSSGNKTITVASDAHVSLTIAAKSGQTGNLLEAKNSSGTANTVINASGHIVSIDGGSA